MPRIGSDPNPLPEEIESAIEKAVDHFSTRLSSAASVHLKLMMVYGWFCPLSYIEERMTLRRECGVCGRTGIHSPLPHELFEIVGLGFPQGRSQESTE